MIKFHLAEDTIDRQDMDRLIDWLKTYPWLTQGKLTAEFEEKWSDWLGTEFSLSCNSGSSANLLMYYTLLLSGKLKNKKVIVPSACWSTTVAPAIQFGFEPILCEADPETFALDLDHLAALLKEYEPSTVVLVHVLGVPHKMDQMLALKKKYGFFLLEDACTAIGTSTLGKKAGTFGDMSSFSFFFGHQISTIEGGMVSTNNKEFYDLLSMIRSHGWSKDLNPETHQAMIEEHQVNDFHNPFVFYVPGFNLRSTDLNAFIGLGQIDKLDQIVQKRHDNHVLYQNFLGEKFCTQRWDDPAAKISSISFGLLAESSEHRQAIVSALVENGIETRLFSAGNIGLHPFWIKRYGKRSFPFADQIYHRGFFLPNHPSLKPEDIEFISQVVLEVVCAQKS